jgi:hypothetical protein
LLHQTMPGAPLKMCRVNVAWVRLTGTQ